MMRCPSCQADNPGEAKFCEKCGQLLEMPVQNINTPVTENEFFKNTWEVWRSGTLSGISPTYKKRSTVSFDRFCERVEMKLPAIQTFIKDFGPYKGEYLIDYSNSKNNYYVLTNQRFFLYDNARNLLVPLLLSEIQEAEVKTGWDANYKITMLNGKVLSFPKLQKYLDPAVLKTFIALSKTAVQDTVNNVGAQLPVENKITVPGLEAKEKVGFFTKWLRAATLSFLVGIGLLVIDGFEFGWSISHVARDFVGTLVFAVIAGLVAATN